MVCNFACDAGNHECGWWLDTAASSVINYLSVHCRTNERGMVKMKINKLVKEINSSFLDLKAIKRDDGILISSSNDDELLLVPEKATNFMDVYFYVDNQGKYFANADREKLSALIEEFLETPVKERFPGKKYRLVAMRYVEGPVAIKQYVTDLQASGDYMAFCFGSKENAVKWTDKELRNMSQWFPQKAIDAMKEPVEE